MKKIFIVCASILFAAMLHAQNVGIGTTSPQATLDVSSTTNGFLPPRMTSVQRDAIATPVAGLVLWCTDCGIDIGELQVYNGLSWRNMVGGGASNPVTTFFIGMFYRGGKIAYILQPGDPGYDSNVPHGLIAAPTDLPISCQWGCVGTNIPGADGTALGTGNQNTIEIIAGCATAGIAARLCGDLVVNGYSDWFLPSKDELNKLYINRVAIGSFNTGQVYSSSSENDINTAWDQYFNAGGQFAESKTANNIVRAIRSF